ncbi:MAG: hypothetical protein R2741_09185 [Methanolobus sp.]
MDRKTSLRFLTPSSEHARSEAYANLDGHCGLVSLRQSRSNDVLIGKTSPPRFLEEQSDFSITVEQRRESAITMRSNFEKGVVDTVIPTQNQLTVLVLQGKERDQRIPRLATSSHQDTVRRELLGFIVPFADMPFTRKEWYLTLLVINLRNSYVL